MDALFFNHLAFMASHRGSVLLCDGGVSIVGPTPDLTSFVPTANESRLPDGVPAVRLAPFSGLGWPARLEAAKYQRAESLSYMQLARADAAFAAAQNVDIAIGRSHADAVAFAGVQAAGFATGEAAIDDWWLAYFIEKACKNISQPTQSFYLAKRGDAAVTSTLVFDGGGVVGIYAVATLPDERRKGMSAALLERVRQDAIKSGKTRIILQATSGSYAETYYTKLGFVTRYTSQVWRLPL